MMTVAISNGLIILLLFIKNTYAQQGVSNNVVNNAGLPQPNTAGVNFNSPQSGQQINWQQPSNMQQGFMPQQPQNYQQPGNSQVKQLNQNQLSDILSALHNLQFTVQKPQDAIPLPTNSCGYKPNYEQTPGQAINPGLPNNQQYGNPESSKPTFTFQFVPVSSQNMIPENQQMNTVPVQYLSSGGQVVSQQNPSYYVQSQPSNQQTLTMQNTSPGQNQPIVFTVNPQQTPTSGPSQSVVYTLQPAQSSPRSSNQQKSTQTSQGPNKSDNPMALLMSQLQSPSGTPDMASILPMLMSSKQEKSGGMKALLPLILNLLSDRSCNCPHCGCPYNNPEPTINGGYSNKINYSPKAMTDAAKIPAMTKSVAKTTAGSNEVEINKSLKKYKTNVISDFSDEGSDEDYEDYDDDDDED